MDTLSVLASVTFGAIVVCAVAYTTFAVVYPIWARRSWWRHPVGRALVISSLASALLFDLTLILRGVAVDELTAAWIACVVIVLIACGGLLKLGALLHEIRRTRRDRAKT